MSMFHLQENVYFERQSDGNIRIVVRQGSHADAPIIKDTTCSVGAFASVMASMCAFGETRETWLEAREFLERNYPGDEAAYRHWQSSHPREHNPLCSCVARGDDSPHNANCPFWNFVLTLRRDWPGRNDYRPKQEGK